MPITMIETDNAARRPARSPKAPMTRPPSGRKKNATPKTASDASNEVVGFPDGKNSAPMVAARNPYTAKSNHSRKWPMPAATATRRDTWGASVPDEVSASVVGASPAIVGGNGDTGGGFVIEVSSGSVVDFFRHDVNLVLRESDRSFGAPMILRLAARSE